MKQNPFSFKSPEDSPGFMLWQTMTAWQKEIKKELEEFGLSHAQFVLLALLMWNNLHKGAVTQSYLVEMSKLDKMTVSKSLKKLVSLKLVKREENIEDTRSKLVNITAKGEALAKKIVPKVEGIDNEFFSSLTKPETKDLRSIFQKLMINKR